jgi:hypothetical protein
MIAAVADHWITGTREFFLCIARNGRIERRQTEIAIEIPRNRLHRKFSHIAWNSFPNSPSHNIGIPFPSRTFGCRKRRDAEPRMRSQPVNDLLSNRSSGAEHSGAKLLHRKNLLNNRCESVQRKKLEYTPPLSRAIDPPTQTGRSTLSSIGADVL